MPKLTWTGARSAGSLLDQAYVNHATVQDDDRYVGYILALPNGYYQPRIDGMMGEQEATPDAAARKVVEMWKEFRQ